MARGSGGAVIVPDKATVLIQNVTFVNNTSLFGGALSIINNPIVKIIRCSFYKFGQHGAAIYLSNVGQPLLIINSSFISNIARTSIFAVVSGTAKLEGIFIKDNYNGFLASSASDIVINNSNIYDSVCQKGIYGCIFSLLRSSKITLYNFTANNISTNESNGNIYVRNSEFTLYNGTLSDLHSYSGSSVIYT